MTLQDNILFGKTLNQELYDDVMYACDLQTDLKTFPAGDRTEIGENGVNLSGGQKQRISLARAVYSEADIYLLDDPLSAVDYRTEENIFDRLLGPSGLLKNKTRVLVTNRFAHLSQVDEVVFVNNGETETGPLKELLHRSTSFIQFLEQYSQKGSPENLGMVSKKRFGTSGTIRDTMINSPVDPKLGPISDGKLIEVERLETKSVRCNNNFKFKYRFLI